MLSSLEAGDTLHTEEKPLKVQTNYESKLGLGFTGGGTSGIGFAIRKHFKNRLGFHCGAFILGGSEEEPEEEWNDNGYWAQDDIAWLWANIGTQVMYTLHRHKKEVFRFYTFVGAQVIFDYGKHRVYKEVIVSDYHTTYEKTDKVVWSNDNMYFIGAGLGLEFLIVKHFGISVECPVTTIITDNGFNILPVGNGSLIYYFRERKKNKGAR